MVIWWAYFPVSFHFSDRWKQIVHARTKNKYTSKVSLSDRLCWLLFFRSVAREREREKSILFLPLQTISVYFWMNSRYTQWRCECGTSFLVFYLSLWECSVSERNLFSSRVYCVGWIAVSSIERFFDERWSDVSVCIVELVEVYSIKERIKWVK